jgi:hypothetical protein
VTVDPSDVDPSDVDPTERPATDQPAEGPRGDDDPEGLPPHPEEPAEG